MTWLESSFDQTYAALTELLEADRQRKAADLAKLNDLIARGWVSSPADTGELDVAPDPRHLAPPARRAGIPASPVDPFVVLPQRTTRGGPFGPKVRAKLIAEALAKPRW